MFPYITSIEAWVMFVELFFLMVVFGIFVYFVFSYIFKKPIKLIFAITDFCITTFVGVLLINYFLM